MTDSDESRDRLKSATRHLCAGAYIDRNFCRQVLEVYVDRSRWVAPSYGFDLVEVARHARRAWWLDMFQYTVILALVMIGMYSSPLAIVVAGVLLVTWNVSSALWRLLTEFVTYVRQQQSLAVLQNLKVRLRLELLYLGVAWAVLILSLMTGIGLATLLNPARTAGGGRPGGAVEHVFVTAGLLVCCAAGVVVATAALRQCFLVGLRNARPAAPTRFGRRLQALAAEGQSRVVCYGDFRPFIGSGVEVTTWSFALRLVSEGEGDERVREFGELPFRSETLARHLTENIRKLANEDDQEIRLPGLTVEDRVFVLGSHGAPDTSDLEQAIARARDDPTGPARHYLACQVVAWEGELVTTVFVHVSMQGRTLYVEFSVWALLPTRPDFYAYDTSAGRRLATHSGRVLQRLFGLPAELRDGPRQLMSAGRYMALGFVDYLGLVPNRRARDAGARISVREEGAIPEIVTEAAAWRPNESIARLYGRRLIFEPMDRFDRRNAEKATRTLERATRKAARAVNYFQTRDIIRHWKVIERRVLASVLDFLEANKIDVQEYRARATQILNNGVVNMFSGTVNAQVAHLGQGNVTNTSQATENTA